MVKDQSTQEITAEPAELAEKTPEEKLGVLCGLSGEAF
jgi:hypothetical protein